jgi:hypothetical protein
MDVTFNRQDNDTIDIRTKKDTKVWEDVGSLNLSGKDAEEFDLLSNEVVHFKLNETAGIEIDDSSDESNKGVAENIVTSVAGLAINTSTAVSFDGASDFISTEESEDFYLVESDFSICFWEKFTSIVADRQCFLSASSDDDNRFELMFDLTSFDNPALFFVISKLGTVTDAYKWDWNPVVGTSYHIILTRKNGEMFCYINTVAVAGVKCESVPFGDGIFGDGLFGYGY